MYLGLLVGLGGGEVLASLLASRDDDHLRNDSLDQLQSTHQRSTTFKNQATILNLPNQSRLFRLTLVSSSLPSHQYFPIRLRNTKNKFEK